MLYLLIPIIYLLIGIFIARHDYAQRLAARPGRSEELERLRANMQTIDHSSSCWLGSTYNYGYRQKECDCGSRKRFNPLREEVLQLEAGKDVPMRGPYPMLFFYPALGLHKFLTSGTVKSSGYDPALVNRLERELEINQ